MTPRDHRIVELHHQDLSSGEIARTITKEGTRTSASTVRTRIFSLRKQGVSLPPRKYANTGRPRKYDHEAIAAYYDEGHSQNQTAKHFNISARAVSYALSTVEAQRCKAAAILPSDPPPNP